MQKNSAELSSKGSSTELFGSQIRGDDTAPPQRFGKLTVRTDANRQTFNICDSSYIEVVPPKPRLRLLDDVTLQKYLPVEEATQEYLKKDTALKMEQNGRSIVEHMLSQPRHAIFGGEKKEGYRQALAVHGPKWGQQDLNLVEPAGFSGLGAYSQPLKLSGKKRDGTYKYGPVPFTYEQSVRRRLPGTCSPVSNPREDKSRMVFIGSERNTGNSCSELMKSYRNHDYTLHSTSARVLPSISDNNGQSHSGNVSTKSVTATESKLNHYNILQQPTKTSGGGSLAERAHHYSTSRISSNGMGDSTITALSSRSGNAPGMNLNSTFETLAFVPPKEMTLSHRSHAVNHRDRQFNPIC